MEKWKGKESGGVQQSVEKKEKRGMGSQRGGKKTVQQKQPMNEGNKKVEESSGEYPPENSYSFFSGSKMGEKQSRR